MLWHLILEQKKSGIKHCFGVIKGSFPETAFDKNGKFQVYVMDKIRALAAKDQAVSRC